MVIEKQMISVKTPNYSLRYQKGKEFENERY